MQNGDGSALCWPEKRMHTYPIQTLVLQIHEAVSTAGIIQSLLH